VLPIQVPQGQIYGLRVNGQPLRDEFVKTFRGFKKLVYGGGGVLPDLRKLHSVFSPKKNAVS
jgi:hypothetical protein